MSQPAGRHRIEAGARFLDSGTSRGYWVRCSCGWESELCATAVFAEALGERHVEGAG